MNISLEYRKTDNSLLQTNEISQFMQAENQTFRRYFYMLKIEDILREDFDWENVEIDEDEFVELENQLIINYLKKNSPKERQLLAIDWNFDNSKEVIKWIAEQPDTDKGTALFLYWYMDPQFFKNYENRRECEEEDNWALEDFDIVETLEKNYISGF